MAAMRFAYDGLDDLRQVASGLTEEEVAASDFGTYPERQFAEDLERTGGGRANPELARTLVRESRPTLRWMRGLGVEFVPLYAGQAFEVDGKRRFWGGLTLQACGGGPGLVAALERAAEKAGVETRYGCRAVALRVEEGAVRGVEVEEASGRSKPPPAASGPEGPRTRRRSIEAEAVVLASGGFEANADWRRRHLGEGWEAAKVRGSRYNEGDGIRMALEAGAARAGQWSGCHAVAWDLNAPEVGNLEVRHRYQKHSYPLGIVVNSRGERFLDEGADFRNYTYARYGRKVLEQPGRFAWQVFDARVAHLLRDEYRKPHATRVEADSLAELAARLDGVDAGAFLRTVGGFNAAVRRDVPFDPSVRDGRSTRGLAPNKSNWANPPRAAAVRGLRGDLRHHVHLRRPGGRSASQGARRGRAADSASVCGGRTRGRPVPRQLSGRFRADRGRGLRPQGRQGGGPGRWLTPGFPAAAAFAWGSFSFTGAAGGCAASR